MGITPLPTDLRPASPPYRNCRILEVELLDTIPACRAKRNVADMARVNRWLGGFQILRRQTVPLIRGVDAPRILDVGAASTHTAGWLQKAIPGVAVTSSDLRHDLLDLGEGERVATDACWLPFRDNSFDVTISTLFLHHLSEPALLLCLREMLRVSRRGVVAVDLLRHQLAYHFLGVTRGILRWDPLTVEDGRRSVQAAFTAPELRGLLEASAIPAKVRAHYPWFRLSVVCPKQSD